MSGFTVYPAIDLRAGKVVRLAQGDATRQTTYHENPAATARHWLEAGAAWLHVVNLNGAFGERDAGNRAALSLILKQSTALHGKVQFGGGMRSLEQVEQALEMGVSRVILGTAAVQTPEMLAQALQRFDARRVAVALDVRDGLVKTSGWREDSGVTPLTLARQLAVWGVKIVVYTNIARDGMGGGTDIAAARAVADLGFEVIASGGVQTLEHVRVVRAAGLSGVIIGRALYEGQVSLEEALKC
jgi:phosphoribosylformimino-5-aminoimidazole carboxamide ribotide isomerase